MTKARDLHFVTFTDMQSMRTPKTLSQIRQHAMKEIGRRRRKPKMTRLGWDLVVPDTAYTMQPQAAIGGGSVINRHSENTWQEYRSLIMTQVHSFLPLPIEIDDTGKELLANVCRSTGSNLQIAHRADWFPVMLADAGTFYQVLSNSALHLSALRDGRPKDSKLSIYYHQLAVTSVRERLQAVPLLITDELVGCIGALIAAGAVALSRTLWLMQMEGLLRLLAVKPGGIGSLTGNPPLRASVSWVELYGAVQFDSPARLPLPRTWLEACKSQLRRAQAQELPRAVVELRQAWLRELPEHRKLFVVFESLAAYASETKSQLSAWDRESGLDLPLWTNVANYTLLGLQSTEPKGSHAHQIVEVCRLSMLMYVMAVQRAYGVSPANTSYLVAKQMDLLAGCTASWSGPWRLRAWALVIGAFEATDDGTRKFYVHALRAAASAESLSCLCELLVVAKSLLWIPAIMDAKADALKTLLSKYPWKQNVTSLADLWGLE